MKTPPIKSQGIKTKLVSWIQSILPEKFEGTWIEPFMGTGVVGFNLAPTKAILCDTNPHLINFYSGVKSGYITSTSVRNYLRKEGTTLSEKGEDHYYFIRERFNETHCPFDFLFLNRAGFNGMIRFNKKGGFNIPFCRKPSRFSKSYITKIVNQVDHISQLISTKDFNFKCQSFEETIQLGCKEDIIYCDPPYIGRHVDYYNGWNQVHEESLFFALKEFSGKFILSTWHHNDFRKNKYIDLLWDKFNIMTREHFYHVGAKETNRRPMIEAIITNYDTPNKIMAEIKLPVHKQIPLPIDN